MRRIKYPCQTPVICWRCGYQVAQDGVLSDRYVFSFDDARRYYQGLFGSAGDFHCLRAEIQLDCGKCVCCLARKRRDMATRLRHERSMHEKCCFITLTYDEDSLPRTDEGAWRDGYRMILDRGDLSGLPTLFPADVQKFIKRLRRHLEYLPVKRSSVIRDHVTTPLRYFCVGEYGGRTGRPHYHLLIFGWSPSDVVIHKREKNYDVYRSAQIEKLWTHGFSTVCEVSSSACSYCAQYVTKKFRRLATSDAWEVARCPEFVLQSVRGGAMGAPWLEKYSQNLRHGYVTYRTEKGVAKAPVPRYYFCRLRRIDMPLWLDLRDERIAFMLSNQGSPSSAQEVDDYIEEVSARVVATREEWSEEDLNSVI